MNRPAGDILPLPVAGNDSRPSDFLSADLASAMTRGLRAQGNLADSKLKRQRLIVTQGGEPTFVPHDASLPEWNVAALGDEKLLYARRLARHLASNAFRGAVVLQSYGKQYPGEPLPRWQIGVYRRRRGKALWGDLNRLQLDRPAKPAVTTSSLRRFIKSLATELKVRATGFPAYEDVEAHLRAHGDSAVNSLLPKFSRRTRSFKAARPKADQLARIAPLLEPAGWVLPLEHRAGKWRTDQWKRARAAGLDLVPGDSPVGLRLPLNHLPPGAVRCALTAERHEDSLIVFLPPCPTFKTFCELVECVESVAAHLKLPPIRLQGYPPPSDSNLDHISLSSDPGVIEVNLPPADCWTDLERVMRVVHDAATESGLRGFKFQPRGRTVSTGGGSHIILGGPSLRDNPFVKRPALLASFLRFFQHHPSLSYVFSGLFTGPSCQGPRVDESAFGLLAELEITLSALEAMPKPGNASRMDAMLRNLLLDWNGNTHRAEISVDKFCNADAPNGQVGLVEFRAFEMMPCVELLLAPNALLRALAATFAETPYRQPLIDWRGKLQNRFSLPWFLRSDLKAVLQFVNKRGFSFEPSWFEPHLDFRFPVVKQFNTGDVRWTLRHAIEPWPVMGDHRGTGRVVDASTDRLELLAEGWKRDTHLAAIVNGIRIPLQQQKGAVAVGAVRYRLFDNPWGLQPHITSHAPLRFEIVDAESNRIIHAFEFHDWKEDKHSNRKAPTTAADAGRRVEQRLVVVPGTRRKPRWQEIEPSPQAPLTLDLRRF